MRAAREEARGAADGARGEVGRAGTRGGAAHEKCCVKKLMAPFLCRRSPAPAAAAGAELQAAPSRYVTPDYVDTRILLLKFWTN